MIAKTILIPAILPGVLLSACATQPTAQDASEQTAPPPAMAMQDHHAMSGAMAENMQAMPEECKAIMARMREKMKAEGMDMTAMKARMQSGEGMSEQQKTCHAMMHKNMQARHGTTHAADDSGS